MRSSIQLSGGVFVRLLSLLAVFFMLASIFGNPATAAPLNDASKPDRKLFARACPSVDSLTNYMRSRGAGDNTVFYTAPATNRQAGALSTILTPRGNYYGSLVDGDDYWKWMDQCNEGGTNPGQQDRLGLRISRAIAEAATGKAYILIPPSADPKAGKSIWVKHEFPTLMRNKAIKEVIRVNPDDINSPDQKETIWKQGDKIDLDESTA